MSTAEGSRPVRITQRRGVAHRGARQRQADDAGALHEEDGHAEVRLLDVPAPVRLVRGRPDLLRDDDEPGQGDEVEEPERVLVVVVGERVGVRAGRGRPRDHQRAVPAGHVADEVDVPRGHLEERLDEERRISLAEHPDEVAVAARERDWSKRVIMVRHV